MNLAAVPFTSHCALLKIGGGARFYPVLTKNPVTVRDSKTNNAAGVEMSRNAVPGSTTDGSTANPSPQVAPTGYRVAIVPGALEVSARLATADELRNLVKVLSASIAILADDQDDCDAVSLTKRIAQTSAA